MSSLKQTESNILSLQSLTDIVRTYQEIAAIRMRRVKQSVLFSRAFLSGLNDLYTRVYLSSKSAGELKKLLKITPKTVSVLFSSNTGLYGDIIRDTFDAFVEDVSTSSTDIVIVGKIGKSLYESHPAKRDYKYFGLSDSGMDTPSLEKILDHTLSYSNIVVYHGYFKTILAQTPKKTFVTGDALKLKQELYEATQKGDKVKVIFEPSREQITAFFETQILRTVFEQTLYESNLSKYASRMVGLDHAAANVESKIKKEWFLLRKQKHRRSDARQREVLSSASLWA